jgi:predicted permease
LHRRSDLRAKTYVIIFDLRDIVRGFGRAKAVTALLLVSLALGTGLNAAVYGLAEALLFGGPPGVTNPSGLVQVYTSQLNGMAYGRFSYPDYLSLTAARTSLTSLVATHESFTSIRLGTSGQRIRVASVSEAFFSTLGLSAYAGRLLDTTDMAGPIESPGGAVISFRLWDLFGRDDQIIGQVLRVDEHDYSIVGIAPEGFRGLHVGNACDVWVALRESHDRGNRNLSVIGRLARGGRLESLQPTLDTLASALAAQHPETNRGTLASPNDPRRITAVMYSPIAPEGEDHATAVGFVILGSTALLLVSACINAGSLLLSKSAVRRRELAVKLALGASRGQLVRQCVIEGLAISLAGGALGLFFAFWTAGAIPSLFAPEHAEMLDTRIGGRIVSGYIAIACLLGVVFSLAPAVHALRSEPIAALRADAGGISDAGGRPWVRGTLVICQVGLSTAFVLITTILIHGLSQTLRGDSASAGRNIGIVVVSTPGGHADPARGLAYQARVVEELRNIEGAAVAGWVGTLPLGRNNHREIRIETARPEVADTVEVDANEVSTGYFHVMGISLVEGRFFHEGDTGLAAPVAIVNDVFARRYFTGPVVGHRFRASDGRVVAIVGVVNSAKYRMLQDAPEPLIYYPLTQDYAPYLHLVVRTSVHPSAVMHLARALMRKMDRNVGIVRSTTLDRHLSESVAVEKLTTALVAVCGVVSLILAAIGVYGVMADAVRRRTREIGLRIALGARWVQIGRLVFGGVLTLTLSGVVIGTFMSIGLAAGVHARGYAVPAANGWTLVGVPFGLLAVVVLAVIVPMQRALRVSPTNALRVD